MNTTKPEGVMEYREMQLVITSADDENKTISESERVRVEGPRDELLTIIQAGMYILGIGVETRNAETGEVLHRDRIAEEIVNDDQIVI